MTPTTIRELRAAIAAVLRGLTPSETPRQDDGWRPVERREDVPGSELRRFYLSFQTAFDDDAGVQAPDAEETPVRLFVYTNYGNLPDDEVENLLASDGIQVQHALQLRTDPTIPGLVDVRWEGWVAEDDDTGRHWGAHEYTIRYLAPGTSV